MDTVHKPSDPECYKPSSNPFTFQNVGHFLKRRIAEYAAKPGNSPIIVQWLCLRIREAFGSHPDWTPFMVAEVFSSS
jgi:hypothetical protein